MTKAQQSVTNQCLPGSNSAPWPSSIQNNQITTVVILANVNWILTMDQVLTTDLIRPLCAVNTIIISLLTDGVWRVTESQGKGFKPKQSDPDQCPNFCSMLCPFKNLCWRNLSAAHNGLFYLILIQIHSLAQKHLLSAHCDRNLCQNYRVTQRSKIGPCPLIAHNRRKIRLEYKQLFSR